jgi:hypothetical protein
MATFNFNIQEVPQDELSTDFEPIPDGWYRAEIIESQIKLSNKSKQNRDQKNKYLELTWRILDGKYARRIVWDMVNIVSESEEALRIGKKELALRCIALGVDQFRDSGELHRRPCMILVGTREASNGFKAKNEVKAARRAEAAAGDLPIPSNGVAADTGEARPPWANFNT